MRQTIARRGRGSFMAETAGESHFAAPAFAVDFCISRKVFARGLLGFLGAWPESLGSASQLC